MIGSRRDRGITCFQCAPHLGRFEQDIFGNNPLAAMQIGGENIIKLGG
jgi:hypothetical protein